MTVGAIFGLARVTTEFGRSDGEFARFALPYRIAISTMTTKVSILTEEFIHGNGYSPIEAVCSRVKTFDSIVAKAQRLRCPLTADDIRRNILDIAGVRITCGLVSDAYRVAALLSGQPDVTLIEVEDYIAKPKQNGYKGLHMIVEIPVFVSNRVERVPVEVQVRTMAQGFSASHEQKISTSTSARARLLDTLSEAADTAHRLDRTMRRLHDEVARWTAASGSDEVQWNSPPPTTSIGGGPIRDSSCEHPTHGNRSTGYWLADMSVDLPSPLKATLD
jgi:putative GTP pyrophosphokinase